MQIREDEEADWSISDRPGRPDSYLVEAAARAKPTGQKELIPDKEALDNSELFCGYTVKQLRDLQDADSELRIVRHWVKDGEAPTRKRMQNARASRDLWAYLQHLKDIRLENGLLVMDRLSTDPPSPTRDTRLLLPPRREIKSDSFAPRTMLWSFRGRLHLPVHSNLVLLANFDQPSL